MRENSELCEEFHPIHLSKQVYSSICLPGETSRPGACLMPFDETVKILHIFPTAKANCCAIVRFTSSPFSFMRQASVSLTLPVSEGVYVMIPCQRNQSLSILKFRFLFHGFQGSASQAKMTIPALFFSCPHLSSHLGPY